VSAFEIVYAALVRLGVGSELRARRMEQASRAPRWRLHTCFGCGCRGDISARYPICTRCEAKLTPDERDMYAAWLQQREHDACTDARLRQAGLRRSREELERQRAIRPGDQVAVFNHPDVVDGARATVLSARPSGWIAIRLESGGPELIVHAADVRLLGALSRERRA